MTPITPERWSRIKELFAQAVELPPEQRGNFLTAQCGDDSSLAAEILELLCHDREGGAIPNARATVPSLHPSGFGATQSVPVEESPGTRVGRYKLLQKIGEGGCGVVYMAEQLEPFQRRVALKIVKLGLETKSVVARFEAERQALALMDHPNIAKILDAGVTESGRPYFVMELVRGVPILSYCDTNDLNTDQRLKLFIQVCNAIQHAHQKGIIHRDIKPSNILVTLHDGTPVPKVIDFGIAKATQGRLTDQTLFTAFEQFIGTPAYMSPEQAEMSGLDVDTRSDIYSLGVLLYELLTGRTPFDAEELFKCGLDAMRQRICEEDPPKPSTRLSTLPAETLTTTAKHRHTDAPRLMRAVEGDLDWIVMKCLEKDRTRRYETASGLANDIRRHMNDDPVAARPPSRVYRWKKLIRRNRLAFACVTVVALAILLGGMISAWEAIRAKRAQRIAVVERASALEARNLAVDARKRETDLRTLAEARGEQLRRNLYLSEMNLAGQAAESLGGLGRVHELLMPWQETSPGLRGWEWYYLNGLCHRELRTLRGHTAGVKIAAWNPDGTRLASGSDDGTIKIWDPSSGREIVSLEGHGGSVLSVAWSPDGRVLASASGRAVTLWDVVGARTILKLASHENPMRTLAWSPDGKRVAGATSDQGHTPAEIIVWDAASGSEIFACSGHTGMVDSVAWSPNGARLASLAWGTREHEIKIWDGATGKELRSYRTPRPDFVPACSVAWSPDGTRLLWPDMRIGSFMLWEVDGDQQPRAFQALGHAVIWIVWSPDGKRLASTGVDRSIRVWEAASGREMVRMRGHIGAVNTVTWSPDGRLLASASDDATIRIWNASSDQETPTILRLPAAVFPVAWSPDGTRLAACSWNGTMKIRDRTTNQESQILTGHDGGVRQGSMAWSPNGRQIAVGGWSRPLSIWDVSSGKEVLALKEMAGCWSIAWSPDGSRFATDQGTMVRVWDADSGAELLALRVGPAGHYSASSVAWSPDGRRLATGRENGIITIWDAATGKELSSLSGHTDQVWCVNWSADGTRLASASFDRTVRIWDAATGVELHTLRGHDLLVNYVAWHPDGTRLASGADDCTIRIWDVASGKESLILHCPSVVKSVAWSPDGKSIACAGANESVLLYDATFGYAALHPDKP